MADTNDTTRIAAAAQADVPVGGGKPLTAKGALRRKVVGRGQTSLSSPSQIVLPPESDAVLSIKAAKPAPIVPAHVAEPTPAPSEDAPSVAPVQPSVAQETASPAPTKRSVGRPRKLSTTAPTLAAPKPAPAKRIVGMPVVPKPMPIKHAVPTPTHAKLPPAAAGPGAARPRLPAPRSTLPILNSHANPSPAFSIKDLTMDMSANFSGFQDAMGQAQAKAQAAFEKSSNMLGEAGDFAKGNVEAVIESSKILADGVQEIGSTLVSEGRTAFEAMTGDIKELAAAKSPTDFLKLQSDMVRKSFDSAVAYSSKNSETFLKLMSDAFAPLSGRVSLAVEKARQVAPLGAALNTPA